MKDKNQALTEKFDEFLGEHLYAFMDYVPSIPSLCKNTKKEEDDNKKLTMGIIFPYGKSKDEQREKMKIAVSLIFWWFLEKFLDNQKERMSFISFFLANNELIERHPLLRTVAMIEALPTTIWRKLLWRENIDFANHEACLRRLDDEQKKAIEDNYNDLFSGTEPVTPRVLKKSWRDRLKLFFGITSVDKILNENREIEERQASKGGWAFSLLGLDFGFSLYPRGDNDDTKITNKKWTRFLSIKEHINDFIVNKEDGKYWWLYRTARSNYYFNSRKKVVIKNHVCPGFWITLIIQTLLWIVSPIALIVASITVTKYGLSYSSMSPVIFAFAMILWGVMALVRTVINLIIKLAETIEKGGLSAKIIKGFFFAIIASIVLFVVILIIGLLMTKIWYVITSLAPICGSLLSTMFVLSTLFYVFFFFACVAGDKPLFKYKQIPMFVRFLLHLSIGGLIIVLFDRFLSEPIINFTVTAAQDFWRWYISDLLITNWLMISFLFLIGLVYSNYIFLTDEKKFANNQKTFTFFGFIFFIFTVLVILTIFFRTGFAMVTELGLMPLATLAVVFLACGLLIYMVEMVNRNTIGEREKAFEFISKINKRAGGWSYKNYISQVLNSKWLSELGDEKWSVVWYIESLATYFFKDDSYYRTLFTELIIRKGSVEIIDMFDSSKAELNHDSEYSDKELLKMIELIIGGKMIEEAAEIILANRSSSEKLISKTKAVLKTMVFPFILFYRIIRWMVIKIKRFFLTLVDIYNLFNKLCPSLSKSYTLKWPE